MIVMNIGKHTTLLGFTVGHNHLFGFLIPLCIENFDSLFPIPGISQRVFTISKSCASLRTQLLYICRSVVHKSLFSLILLWYSTQMMDRSTVTSVHLFGFRVLDKFV